MKRRSFFGVAAAASGAAILPAGAVAAILPASAGARAGDVKVVRTAVTSMCALSQLAPTEFPVEIPADFVPVAVATGNGQYSGDVSIRLFDDEGDVIDVHSDAFRFGPLDLWRPVVGKLRCEVTPNDYLSVLPCTVVIIYGEIDIE
jgi:hypothetical protein